MFSGKNSVKSDVVMVIFIVLFSELFILQIFEVMLILFFGVLVIVVFVDGVVQQFSLRLNSMLLVNIILIYSVFLRKVQDISVMVIVVNIGLVIIGSWVLQCCSSFLLIWIIVRMVIRQLRVIILFFSGVRWCFCCSQMLVIIMVLIVLLSRKFDSIVVLQV